MSLPTLSLPGLRGETIQVTPGRPMLIVNTASLCGFTGQYAGLQRVWTAYADRGLQVLAVPSADFGNQEHGSADETLAVCDGRFGATFPIAATTHVTGAEATPLFRWIAQEAGALGRPRWNFYKYVVSREGRLAAWFSSVTQPDAGRVRRVLERCLVGG